MGKSKKNCSVIVGNIGTTLDNASYKDAKEEYDDYVEISKNEKGRAGNESVSLFCEGELIEEFIPDTSDDD